MESPASAPSDIPSDLAEGREQLRIAMVMTGGVSLAVWMGGVATEVDRLTDREEAYGELQDLVRTDAQVDVIGGTSAGGINGALLAMAIAQDADVSTFRTMWLEDAALETMLRSPTEERPPSLLKGDEYFLKCLQRAFTGVAKTPTDPAERPVHLVMTTTLLRGERRAFQDDFGARIQDLTHKGTFTYRRGGGWDGDDFTGPDAVDKLALACRCTASFPGAFEASFCPVGTTTKDPFRPDMSGHADFGSSHFVIDGGVLMNKPLQPVLRVIFTQPGEGEGRRVLAYVIPDPGLPVREGLPTGAPAMTQVVLDSMQIPRVESVSEELESIRTHNRRVIAQRRLRESLLGMGEGGGPDTAGAAGGTDLTQLAAQLFPAYLEARKESTTRSLIEQLVRGLRMRPAGAGGSGGEEAPASDEEPGLPGNWDRARVRTALLDALEPELPSSFPATDEDALAWAWTPADAEAAAATVADLVRRGLKLASVTDPGMAGPREDLLRAALDLRRVRASLRGVGSRERAYWRAGHGRGVLGVLPADPAAAAAQGGTDPKVAAWAAAELPGRPTRHRQQEVFALAWRAAEILLQARSALDDVAQARGGGGGTAGASGSSTVARKAALLGSMSRRLASGGDPAAARRELAPVLRWLLAVAVVESAVAGGEPAVEQVVELMQISAEVENGFDRRRTAGEKLAGLQLGHFGAFYKRSWRANDWMWGRLDAVPSLVRIVLDPYRLRQLATVDPSFGARCPDLVRAVALGKDEASAAVLEPLWDDAAVRAELAYLADPDLPPPRKLPASWGALSRRIQLGILQDELPNVGAAARHDIATGGFEQASTRAFLEALDRGLGQDAGTLPPEAALGAFELCRVGEERFTAEASSRLYERTANTATAIGLQVARGRSSTPKDKKKKSLSPMASYRRYRDTVSPVVRSVVSSSRALFAIMAFLLVLGAGLLSVGIFSDPARWGYTTGGGFAMGLGLAVALLRAWGLRRFVAGGLIALATLLIILSLLLRGSSFFSRGGFRVAVVLLLAFGVGWLAGGPPSRQHPKPPGPTEPATPVAGA